MVQSPGECIRIIHNTEESVDYRCSSIRQCSLHFKSNTVWVKVVLRIIFTCFINTQMPSTHFIDPFLFSHNSLGSLPPSLGHIIIILIIIKKKSE